MDAKPALVECQEGQIPPTRHDASVAAGGHSLIPSPSAVGGHAVDAVPLPVLHMSAAALCA